MIVCPLNFLKSTQPLISDRNTGQGEIGREQPHVTPCLVHGDCMIGVFNYPLRRRGSHSRKVFEEREGEGLLS